MGSLRDAFDHLEIVDVDALDARGTSHAIACAVRLRGWLDARMVALTRHATDLHTNGAGGRPEVVVGRQVGKTEASKIARRATALETVPAFERALEDGQITAAHADAMTAAVAQTPAVADHQAELLQAALTMGPDDFRHMTGRAAILHSDDGGIATFEKQRSASVVKRWIDKATGMYILRAELDPERGAQVWAAIDAHIETQFHSGATVELSNDQRAAIAVHALTTSGGTESGVRTTMHVHIDLDTLRTGIHKESHVDVDGGGTLPVETLRRMACDADIIPHVLNSHGVELDQGRAKRLATAAQRHALRAMHPTCAAPGCSVAFVHTKIHHLTPWQHGGRTDLDQMVPLCERHHHDTHEGGWCLHLDPTTRAVTFTPPKTPP